MNTFLRGLTLRTLTPDDEDVVLRVFDGLGPDSRYHRFLVPKPHLTVQDLRQLVSVDDRDHVALVAFVHDEPVGIGRFVRDRLDPTTAELAVSVVDAWQRRTIGTALAQTLSGCAINVGVQRFSAVLSRENHGAVRLLASLPGRQRLVGLAGTTAEYTVELGRSVPLSA